MLEEGFKFGAGLTPLDFSALGSSRNHHVHASEEPRAIAACGHAEGAQDRAERDPRELRNFHEFDMLELATLAVTKFASSSLPAPLATSSSLPPPFFSP